MKIFDNPDWFKRDRMKQILATNGEVSYCSEGHRKLETYPLILNHQYHAMLYALMLFRGEFIRGYHFRRVNCRMMSLEYVRAGSLAVRRLDRTMLIEPGEVFLMLPFEDSEVMTGPDGFCIKDSLALNGTLLTAYLEQSILPRQDFLADFNSRKLELILQNFQDISGRDDEETKRRNSVLCYELLQCLSEPDKPAAPPSELLKLTAFLQTHLEYDIPLNEMAKRCGYSKSYLLRQFRKFYQTTPHKMLIQLRLTRVAQLLLIDQSLSIKEIAQKTGYGNALNLSTEFRRHYQMSPREYRNVRKS